jgi:hypothetical protein
LNEFKTEDQPTIYMKNSRIIIMNGFDEFLYKAILDALKNELSEEKTTKIEQKLHTNTQFQLADLVTKFDKIKGTLVEFERELQDIEDLVLRNFVEVQPSSGWVTIKNKTLVGKILKTFADPEKKTILNFLYDNPETIPKILVLCNLPNTSGYRKMSQLIDDGFAVPVGLSESHEGRRAVIFKSIIQKTQIGINKNQVDVRIFVPKMLLRTSEILGTLTRINQDKPHHIAN